jgi:hypothetical protein
VDSLHCLATSSAWKFCGEGASGAYLSLGGRGSNFMHLAFASATEAKTVKIARKG